MVLSCAVAAETVTSFTDLLMNLLQEKGPTERLLIRGYEWSKG